MQDFATELRQWRGRRRLSQLGLAGEAGVSSRHLSFLETGRARPSREMVLRLAEALDLPLEPRNSLLAAAGFAPFWPRRSLDDAALAPVRRALHRMLDRHAPYPGVLLDREWRLAAMNAPARRLFALSGFAPGDSLLATLPETGPGLIENWGEVGHHALVRLRAESRAAGGIDALDRAAARLAADPAVSAHRPANPPQPFVRTRYRAGDLRLSLFSTFAQVGMGEDILLSGLKLELMFPETPADEAVLEALSG